MTLVRQIAHDVLGVDDVVLAPVDTAIGSAGSTSASRQTWMSGGAVQAACEAVQRRIDAGDTGVIEEEVTFRHAATSPLDEDGQGDAHVSFAFAAHRAVVDVDPELGLVRVVDMTTAQDVGRVLNPLQVVGQIEGGTLQGVGLAVMEEMKLVGGPGPEPDLHRLPDPHRPRRPRGPHRGADRGARARRPVRRQGRRRAADPVLHARRGRRHPRRHRPGAAPGPDPPRGHLPLAADAGSGPGLGRRPARAPARPGPSPRASARGSRTGRRRSTRSPALSVRAVRASRFRPPTSMNDRSSRSMVTSRSAGATTGASSSLTVATTRHSRARPSGGRRPAPRRRRGRRRRPRTCGHGSDAVSSRGRRAGCRTPSPHWVPLQRIVELVGRPYPARPDHVEVLCKGRSTVLWRFCPDRNPGRYAMLPVSIPIVRRPSVAFPAQQAFPVLSDELGGRTLLRRGGRDRAGAGHRHAGPADLRARDQCRHATPGPTSTSSSTGRSDGVRVAVTDEASAAPLLPARDPERRVRPRNRRRARRTLGHRRSGQRARRCGSSCRQVSVAALVPSGGPRAARGPGPSRRTASAG